MKTILIGRRHGKKNWEMIAGPNVTPSEQIGIRNKLNSHSGVSDDWAEVEMHQEAPFKARLRFVTVKEAEAQAIASKKSDEDFEAQRKAVQDAAVKRGDAEAAAKLKAHQEEVARINKQHDELRKSFPQ